jgi:hypothetical protein
VARLHGKGLLDVPEPHLAASRFFGMVWGLSLRHVLGVDAPTELEELERHVQTAVRDFLVAHRPG